MSVVSNVTNTQPLYTYTPKVTTVLDKPGGLYQAKLPDSSEDDPSVGLVYSAKGLNKDSAVPTAAIYLKDTAGDYFSVDADKVSMVASGKDLNLYVFQADGTADKYAFNLSDGKLKSDAVESVGAISFSSVEAAAMRDLDGNGGIGASLDKTSGVLDTQGGLLRVTSMGEELFVVGAGLDKSKSIDASKATLLNADGTAWGPEGDFESFSAVSTTSKAAGTTWAVYATDAKGDVTRFNFDKDRKIVDDDTQVLTVNDLAAAEKQTLRDLNKDNVFGVNITGTVDSKTGLFKGKVLGQDFYLVGNALKSGTAKAPTDLSGSLLDSEGNAWGLPKDYAVSAMVKNEDKTYSVYAYQDDGQNSDKTKVLRFDFAADGDTKNLKVTTESAEGIEVDATAMAAAEKLAKRDLNTDSVFGVKVDSTVDAVGGLYAASALGGNFLLVGKALTSSASKPLDLSSALKTNDGEAWRPDGVTSLAGNARVVSLGADKGYEVYVKEDVGTYAKYTFDKDYTATGDRTELSNEDLAAAEKTYKRDLNGDSAYGVKVSGLVDAKSGLYKGEFEDQKNIYLVSGTQKLTVGSKVAASGVDLSLALKVDDAYWNADEGYSVTAGFKALDADGKETGEFVLIATSTTNANDVRQYTFNASNLLVDEAGKTGDMSLFDLAAAEKAQRRDLNGDKITGAKATTLDKIGGLHTVTLGAGDNVQTFLTVATKAADVKDLSSALVDAEGNAWKLGDGEKVGALVAEKAADGKVAGYSLYTSKTVGGAQQITRYSFGTDYKYDDSKDDNAKVLSLAEIADAEAASFRDINGDKSVGAKVTAVLDKTGGLYQATMNDGTADTVVTFVFAPEPGKSPGKATSLSDKMLLAANESTPWKVDDGFDIKGVIGNSTDGYSVYASKSGTPEEVRRYVFDKDRVFTESEVLTADQLVAAEKTAGRDFNGDKAVGLNIAEAVDRKGSLYNANVLGQDYLVVGTTPGTALKTGKTAASAIDLSRALLAPDGSAWKPENGAIAGVVTNKDGGYDVYTYEKDDKNAVSAVKVHNWSDKLEYLGSSDADHVALVEVEKTAKRDLSGDGIVGFRKLDTLTEGYAGVTEAKVAGNITFLLAGSKLKNGTPTNPLSMKDALLNEDGSGPWVADAGFNIKAVDDNDTALTAGKRYVYALNDTTKEVRRYEFDKTNGKVSGAGVTVSAVDLAAKELSRKRDFDGDGQTAVTTTVSALKDGDRQTGLLTANMLGQDFLVINKMPLAGRSINLTAALLDADGKAWANDAAFAIKGVYETQDGDGKYIAEVYGVNNDDKTIQRYTFAKQDNGTYMLSAADPETVTGVGIATREAEAKKDLNGDASIGFKVSSGAPQATQSNGWSVGTAAVDTPEDAADGIDSPTIYIVGKNLSQMGAVASNLANNAALLEGDGSYWKPADGASVVSLVQNEDGVSIYTSSTDTDGVTSYVKHAFAQTDGQWSLSASTDLSSAKLIEEEAATKRDLNNDTAVGLKVDSRFNVSGMSKAVIDDQTYYFAGNVYSGTGIRPLDLSNTKLLQADDSTAEAVKAWSTTESITSWEVLGSTLPEGAPDGAQYLAKWDGGSQYFDSSMKVLTAA